MPTTSTDELSPDDVVWAYRLLLNRDPENESTASAKLGEFSTRQTMVQALLNSPECRQSMGFRIPGLMGVEPALRVDQLAPGQLDPLWARVRSTWENYGRTAAHWSVLTDTAYRPENLESHLEQFYDSGRHDVERIQRTLERNGIDASKVERCLELGCGVGRVTRWLAEAFPRVIALDISSAHLEVARDTLSQTTTSVDFRRLVGPESLDEVPEVELVYSFLVLQHNPPPIIEALLRGMMGRLRSGGVALFQVPTYCAGYSYVAGQEPPGGPLEMEMHLLPQERIFRLIEACGCRPLEVLEDAATAVDQWISNTFLVQRG